MAESVVVLESRDLSVSKGKNVSGVFEIISKLVQSLDCYLVLCDLIYQDQPALSSTKAKANEI